MLRQSRCLSVFQLLELRQHIRFGLIDQFDKLRNTHDVRRVVRDNQDFLIFQSNAVRSRLRQEGLDQLFQPRWIGMLKHKRLSDRHAGPKLFDSIFRPIGGASDLGQFRGLNDALPARRFRIDQRKVLHFQGALQQPQQRTHGNLTRRLDVDRLVRNLFVIENFDVQPFADVVHQRFNFHLGGEVQFDRRFLVRLILQSPCILPRCDARHRNGQQKEGPRNPRNDCPETLTVASQRGGTDEPEKDLSDLSGHVHRRTERVDLPGRTDQRNEWK